MYKCPAGKYTIGYGHNLDNNKITVRVADLMFDDDYDDAIKSCSKMGFWNDLDAVRQYVLVDMCFNLGIERLSKFTKMLEALNNKDYEAAANEILSSDYARQVKWRAQKNAMMMRHANISPNCEI
jgi:lysozyme